MSSHCSTREARQVFSLGRQCEPLPSHLPCLPRVRDCGRPTGDPAPQSKHPSPHHFLLENRGQRVAPPQTRRLSWTQGGRCLLQWPPALGATSHGRGVERGPSQRLSSSPFRTAPHATSRWLRFEAEHIFTSNWFQTSIRDTTHYQEFLSAPPGPAPGLGLLFQRLWGCISRGLSGRGFSRF